MNKRGVNVIAIFCVSVFTLFFTFGNTQVTEATSFTSKYTISVNGDNVDTKVYVDDGRTYIPLRELTDALGYTISYSKVNELDVFHNYDIEGAAKNVSVWGNER